MGEVPGRNSGRGDRGTYRALPRGALRSPVLWDRLPGLTHEQALENMRLFAAEVAPKVREAVETA